MSTFNQNDLSTLESHAYAAGDTEQARLLGLAADALQVIKEDNACLLQEARTGFPGEDCLEECKEKIEDILLDSDSRISKARIKQIMELLDSTQTELSNSAAYGREQLDKYMKAIAL